eukprot:m.198618 g.198618  ORF g.198618 m.198618 type:complete len:957 (+) comp20488_c0_seq1:113-2983(+)
MPFHVSSVLLGLTAIVVHSASSSGTMTSVPQWGRMELNWTVQDLPPNPFLVDLNATFSLSSQPQPLHPKDSPTAAHSHHSSDHRTYAHHHPRRHNPEHVMTRQLSPQQDTQHPVILPPPLVALDFEQGGDGRTLPNQGTSRTSSPVATLVAVERTADVPAGAHGMGVDMGNDTTTRRVVLVGGNHSDTPFQGLAGRDQFTITGWLHASYPYMGDGGNRIVNYCAGKGGVDLVWVAGGQLKLSVNEWPDDQHPMSSLGTVPVSADTWPRWVFFAVSYHAANDSLTKTANVSHDHTHHSTHANTNTNTVDTGPGTNLSDNVAWYFGDSVHAASRDTSATNGNYHRGNITDPSLPLAFGNFGPGFPSANDRMFRGKMYQMRLYDQALTLDQIIAVQNRSNCRPRCEGRSCGSDGCGGMCGTGCNPPRTCHGDNGTCELPTSLIVGGFYDGDGVYRVRFSPPHQGVWTYTTHATLPSLSGHTGAVEVTLPTAGDHGPVESRGFGLVHADGTPHISVGTTCYQWSSKGSDMQHETLSTLAQGPDNKGPVFNKIRMTVFPKWYSYNHANPVEMGTPYAIIPGSVAANTTVWNCVGATCPPTAGSFDLRRFNVSYWQNYERLVTQLHAMNIVADVIVFHPYDQGHWGFDCMGGRDPATYNISNDAFYLKYLAARLGAYSNVWWAMANEWSFCNCKSRGINASHLQSPSPVWDALFNVLSDVDPYGRQTSIHNGNLLYNHSRPWITHVSLQGLEDQTPQIRQQYGKPVIWDEVRYEGDVPESWGALSGEEETDRFWWGASLGVSVGHSETILRPAVTSDDAQPLWWAKGGTLVGTSPARIRWFRQQWATNFSGRYDHMPPFGSLQPTQTADGNSGGQVANVLTSPDGGLALWYFVRAGQWNVTLPGGPTACPSSSWLTTVVDYWGMTVSDGPVVPRGTDSVLMDVPALPCTVVVGCTSTPASTR